MAGFEPTTSRLCVYSTATLQPRPKKLTKSLFSFSFQLVYAGRTIVGGATCLESLKILTKILKLKPIAVSVVVDLGQDGSGGSDLPADLLQQTVRCLCLLHSFSGPFRSLRINKAQSDINTALEGSTCPI